MRIHTNVLFILFLSIFFPGCLKPKLDRRDDIRGTEAVTVEHVSGKLKISIDPRIELLTVVQYLAGDPLLIRSDGEYNKAVTDYFAGYEKHKAVKLSNQSRKSGFSYDAPPTSMLAYSDPPQLQKIIPYPDDILTRIGGKNEKRLDEYFDTIRDFSDYALIVYGTMEGNSWLEKHRLLFPFTISSDKIAADKVYAGNHLQFITALPNPVNKKKGMVIYTAQDAADIINIIALFHGPTDYLIADAAVTGVPATGSYTNKEAVWRYNTNRRYESHE